MCSLLMQSDAGERKPIAAAAASCRTGDPFPSAMWTRQCCIAVLMSTVRISLTRCGWRREHEAVVNDHTLKTGACQAAFLARSNACGLDSVGGVCFAGHPDEEGLIVETLPSTLVLCFSLYNNRHAYSGSGSEPAGGLYYSLDAETPRAPFDSAESIPFHLAGESLKEPSTPNTRD